MPRAPSSKYDSHADGSMYYNASYSDTQGNGEPYMEPQQIMPVIQEPVPRKKHVCPTCDKTFTTSGHLARHARVHTGEKNHKCPFPGCETRCSRQDNLQQHYRIHLSPGSRRTSTAASRTSMMRTWPNGPTASKRRSRTANSGAYSSESPPAPSQSPPLDPPALEQAHSHDSPPGPDSPPALVQANLPGMVAPYPDSVSSRSASPHEYSSVPAYLDLPSVNYPMGGLTHPSKADPSYLESPTAYRDHPQNVLYGYDSESSTHTRNDVRDEETQNHPFSYSYDHSQSHVSLSPIHHLHHSEPTHTHTPPPTSNDFTNISSARHSISDIPQSQAYSHPPPPLTGPPSPASVRSGSSRPSLASAPHTPAYPYRNELPDANGYQAQDPLHPPSTSHSPAFGFRDGEVHKANGYSIPDTTHDPIPDAGNLSAGYYNAQGDVVSGEYPVGLPAEPPVAYSDRYAPLAVPTQTRVVPAENHMTHSSSSLSMAVSSSAAVSPYIHHPRPMAGLYPNTLPQLTLQPVDWGRTHQAAIPGVHH